MATLSPDPRGRPTPHPAANSRRGTRCCSPPGTQEAGGRRRASPQPRLPGRRRAPSSKSRRGSRAASARSGDPRAVAPSPCPEPAAGRAAASRLWVDSDAQAVQLRLPEAGGDRAFCSSPPGSAQLVLPLTARRSQRGQPAPVLPSRRREGPWDAGAARGRDAGRGRESQEQVARAKAEAQPSTRRMVALPTVQEPRDMIEGVGVARDPEVSLLFRTLWTP